MPVELCHNFYRCQTFFCVACEQVRVARHMHVLETNSPLEEFKTGDWEYFVSFVRDRYQLERSTVLLPIYKFIDCGLKISNMFICSTCCLVNAKLVCARLDWDYFEQAQVKKGIFS